MFRTRKGFTLVELLVVLGIIALLLSILLPGMNRIREITQRTKCQTNLRGIMQSVRTYAESDTNRSGPKADDNNADDRAAVVYFVVGDHAAGNTTMPAGAAESHTASLWLLVRENYVQPAQFICPSSDDVVDDLSDTAGNAVALENTWDFSSESNLSYSSINMFSTTVGGYWNANSTAPGNYILMADRAVDENRTAAQLQTPVDRDAFDALSADNQDLANSVNHEGQAFVRPDTSTGFESQPNFGPSENNIYALGAGATANAPTSNDSDPAAADVDEDVMMVPVRDNS